MSIRLFVVGLSHRTAPVDLRERVDFGRGGIEAALDSLAKRGAGQEITVLSTCNRAEVYVAGDGEAAVGKITSFFADYHDMAADAIAPHLYVHHGADAARHLFRVAAGLDSLVVAMRVLRDRELSCSRERTVDCVDERDFGYILGSMKTGARIYLEARRRMRETMRALGANFPDPPAVSASALSSKARS